MESLRGSLLVASPALVEPNFRRSVILLAEHSEEGAMGLVLSRPSETTVEEAIPPLAELVPPGDVVHVGGPVQQESVLVLAEYEDPDEAEARVFDGVAFMPGNSEPEEVAAQTRRARVYVGYAGWGAGQLEAELEEESWIVVEAEAADVFAPPEEDLWSVVLARQGGALALLARMPLDPSLN